MVYVGGMCASAMVMLPCRAASSDDNEAVHWQQAPAFQENYITCGMCSDFWRSCLGNGALRRWPRPTGRAHRQREF